VGHGGVTCDDAFALTVHRAGGRVLLPAEWERRFFKNQMVTPRFVTFTVLEV